MCAGCLGMFQNVWLAAKGLPSQERNLPLRHLETMKTHKDRDNLMGLDVAYGRGVPLLDEFFPGPFEECKSKWLTGDKDPYEAGRRAQMEFQGVYRHERSVPSPHFLGDNNLWHRNSDREKSCVTYEPSSLKGSWAVKCRGNAQVGLAPGTASAPPEVAQEDSQEVLKS